MDRSVPKLAVSAVPAKDVHFVGRDDDQPRLGVHTPKIKIFGCE